MVGQRWCHPRNNANPGVAAPVGSNPFAPAPPGGQPGQPGGPSRGVPDEGATGPMLGKGSELEKVTRQRQKFVAKNAHRFLLFFNLVFFLWANYINPQIFLGVGICEGVFCLKFQDDSSHSWENQKTRSSTFVIEYIIYDICVAWFTGKPLGGTSDHEKRTK